LTHAVGEEPEMEDLDAGVEAAAQRAYAVRGEVVGLRWRHQSLGGLSPRGSAGP